MKKTIRFLNTKGVSALITTIVISTVALLLIVGMTLTNIDLNQTSINRKMGADIFYGADSCVEEASNLLRNDNNYTGGSLAVSGVNCTILVEGSGTQRTLTVTTSLDGKYFRGVRAIVDWSDGYHITNWGELTD